MEKDDGETFTNVFEYLIVVAFVVSEKSSNMNKALTLREIRHKIEVFIVFLLCVFQSVWVTIKSSNITTAHLKNGTTSLGRNNIQSHVIDIPTRTDIGIAVDQTKQQTNLFPGVG